MKLEQDRLRYFRTLLNCIDTDIEAERGIQHHYGDSLVKSFRELLEAAEEEERSQRTGQEGEKR